MSSLIHLILPMQLQMLASSSREVQVPVEGPVTINTVLDALEMQYPMLRGTLRNQITGERRPFVRFYASGEDLSLDPLTNLLPEKVASGEVPLRIVGSMAGG